MNKVFYFQPLGVLLMPGQATPLAPEVFYIFTTMSDIRKLCAVGYLSLYEKDVKELEQINASIINRKNSETDPDKEHQISAVSFERLMGKLKPDGQTKCNHVGCDEYAICLVGSGILHPSCENHAQNSDKFIPLPGI